MRFVDDLYSYEKRKWKLLKTYSSFSLEEVLDGCICENLYGDFYLLENDITIGERVICTDFTPLISQIRLVKGIGKKRYHELKQKGVKDLNDLTDKKIYVEDSKKLLRWIDNGEYLKIFNRIEKKLPKSHPIYLSLICAIGLEEMMIFDIESLGFSGSPIFLIGTATFTEKGLRIKQYLARDESEEKSILEEFKRDMEDKMGLISFNGRRFDENLIKNRAKEHELNITFSKIHVDLLNIAKGYWGERCDNFELSTLENEILETERKNDIPSALVPHFYRSYIDKENPGTLLPIIEHNKRDMISIARLFEYF